MLLRRSGTPTRFGPLDSPLGRPSASREASSAPCGGSPACGPRTRWPAGMHGVIWNEPLGSPADARQGTVGPRSCVVPQDPDPEGVQVVRRHHVARARAGRDGRRRTQRQRQVQRRRRHRMGARGPGAERGAVARRWTTSSSPAPPSAGARPGRGRRSRSTTPRACCRSSSPRSRSPAPVPQRRQRVRHQRRARAGCSTSRSCCRDTGVGRQQHVIISQGQIDAVLNARPEDRRRHHRRGRRRAEVPPAQGEGRAPPGRDRGQPHPRCRTCSARCAASSGRSSARPTPPAATAPSSPSSSALRLHVAGRELAALAGPARAGRGHAGPSSAHRRRR